MFESVNAGRTDELLLWRGRLTGGVELRMYSDSSLLFSWPWRPTAADVVGAADVKTADVVGATKVRAADVGALGGTIACPYLPDASV